MDVAQQLEFLEKSKKIGIAYLLWATIGILGFHNLYIENLIPGCVQFGLGILAFFLMLAGSGLSMFIYIALCIWLLIDAFLIPSKINKENFKLKIRLENEGK